MKIKRHKNTKRILKFYKYNHDIDSTKYVNILIDGTFANEALTSKINLKDQLPNFFGLPTQKCNLLTTRCAFHETELLGKPTYGAMLILKQYQMVECQHKRSFVTAEKCFKTFLNHNRETKTGQHYFVASQSPSLKTMIRGLTGIPLIIISHNAINLEKPAEQKEQIKADMVVSNVKHDIAKRVKSQATIVGESGQLKGGMEVLQKLKQKLLKEDKSLKSVFKRKKAKGPNPLSCKKKKNSEKAKQNEFKLNKKSTNK